MPHIKISKSSVDAVPKPVGNDELYWDIDPEGPRGFGLRITPKGVRAYVYQYRMRGRPARRITIGKHGEWTPKQARERAKAYARDVDMGLDPMEEQRKREREVQTLGFRAYIETFTDGYLKTDWGDSWPQAKRQLEMHVLPHLEDKPLPSIQVADLNPVFDALRTRPALQRNVYAVLRKLFNWADKRDDVPYSPMSKMNAPKGVGRRKRVLSPDELLAIWRASYSLDPPRGSLVRLLMITLQRRSEVAQLPWTELSKDDCVWTLPGERAKNGQEHLVPLNELAMAELDLLSWKRRGLVMPSSTGKTPVSNFSDIKAALDKAMLPILQELADKRAIDAKEPHYVVEVKPWRLHDLRRTGTTQMQALGFPIEVTERVINHHEGGEAAGIRAVYNLYEYLPEKTRAMAAWGGFLTELIEGRAQPGNVIALAERRA